MIPEHAGKLDHQPGIEPAVAGGELVLKIFPGGLEFGADDRPTTQLRGGFLERDGFDELHALYRPQLRR